MSIYRTSTANNYDRARLNIQQRQSELGVSQEQLSSGKRVAKASDDAVAATLSERTQNRQARTEADLRALEASRRSLQQAEGALSTASDLYHRFKELVVQAGDGALGSADRRSISAEIKGIREQLLELSNQKDTAGKPLFAGLGPLNSAGRPFVEQMADPAVNQTTYGPDGRSVSWDAQRGQVAATENTLPAGLDGYSVFKGTAPASVGAIVARTAGAMEAVGVTVTNAAGLNAGVFDTSADALGGTQGQYTIAYQAGTSDYLVTPLDSTGAVVPPGAFVVTPTVSGTTSELAFQGLTVKLTGTPAAGDTYTVTPAVDRDIFETLDRAIGALDQGEQGYDLNQELAVVHDQLALRHDQLLLARGKLGDWLNRADQMAGLFEERSVAYQAENSELVDVDMVDAVSRFQLNNTAYQAALQSYAQVQKLSMFDYLR